MCNVNGQEYGPSFESNRLKDKKMQIVNNEHQLQTVDPKTNLTLILTFQKSVWDAVKKYIAVHEANV